MDWVTANWQWIVAMVVGLLIVRSVIRRQLQATMRRQALVSAAMIALDELERIVEMRVGCYFSTVDRQKIAVGMMAVLIDWKVTPSELQRSPQLIDQAMLASMGMMAQHGEIEMPPQISAAVRR